MSKISEGSKVCIIGAGAVGATIAFAISMKQLCSELVLIDVNKDKALGEALDISHGLPFLGQMDIHSGDYCDIYILKLSGSEVAIYFDFHVYILYSWDRIISCLSRLGEMLIK